MKIAFYTILVFLLLGCAGSEIKSFNDGAYSESDLVIITTHQVESTMGFGGVSMYFSEVDGRRASSLLEKPPKTIKVTPGVHTLKVAFNDYSFSLNRSYQNLLITFAIDAIKGRNYHVFFEVNKTATERVTLGAQIGGYLEDKTTGKKYPFPLLNKIDPNKPLNQTGANNAPSG